MKPTFAEDCYLIIDPFSRLTLLFPVLRVWGKPVWYSLCSVICGPEAIDQIYNETLFTKEGRPRNGDYYAVSVYGTLNVETDVLGRLGLRFDFNPGLPPYWFYLEDITVQKPVKLPFAMHLFSLSPF